MSRLLIDGNDVTRSYGRIKNRKLSNSKSSLLTDLLPLYEFKPDESKDFLCDKTKVLEIGFGYGDFLYQNAKRNPDSFFIGCEPHINSTVNLLSKLNENPLNNIKVFSSDVRLVLSRREILFDKVYILFSDPWPKRKHYKRRLINVEFLKLLADSMKDGASLIIATDHDTYKTWILNAILASTQFEWLAKSKLDWMDFGSDWTTTKYQKKALQEGRTPIILRLKKHGA